MRYRQGYDRFSAWYEDVGRMIMGGKDMDESDEELWMLWLAHEDIESTFEGMRSRLFGIKFYFKMFFGFDPFKMDKYGKVRHFERFEMVFRQMKRNNHKRPAKKFSITKMALLKCQKVVRMDVFDDVLVWAIIVVGVHCLLRWSEITDSGKGACSVDKLLRKENLGLTDAKLWLDLNDTKTKIFGDPMTVDCLANGSLICPVRAMKKWLLVRPKNSDWIFCDKKGRAVKTRWVQKVVKGWLKKCGYEERDMKGGMSMRKGGALSMALCGVPDRVIRAYGRWKSFAYRTYIDLTTDEKNKWEKVMADKMRDVDEEGYGDNIYLNNMNEDEIMERLKR